MKSRIPILIVAVLILFIICFFTAQIYTYSFAIAPHAAHVILIITLVLPILYIASMIGSRTHRQIGRVPFIIINALAGIFFYLFLGAIVLGLTSLGFIIASSTIPMSVSWIILALSLVATLVAFIQAQRIVVTHYNVALPNAPASWHGKTAAMISDTHFGLTNYKTFSDKIVSKILSLKPDLVLHAGDFYDGPKVDTAPITESWKKLTAKVPLFYTPGNHEAYGDYNVFVESVRATGATILDDKIVEHDGVQIAGVLYRGGKENPEVTAVLAGLGIDKQKPTILIHHPPTAFIAPEEHAINLIVSGHTHQGQFWPLRYITHQVYGKYDYGMHQYKNLTSITSDGIGTWGPQMRLFNSPEVVLIHFT